MTLLEVCVHNLPAGEGATLQESEHRVRTSTCLDRCDACSDGPFVMLDGEFRAAGTYRAALSDRDESGVGEE